MSEVLVTGGSGYIGSWCVLALLGNGHTVRTTVRDLRKEPAVRAMLRAGGASIDAKLTVLQADLQQDAGWCEAVDGCEYVLHVASPTLTSVPKNEDEMIVPARDGVLRVLRAARAGTSVSGRFPRSRPASPRPSRGSAAAPNRLQGHQAGVTFSGSHAIADIASRLL
jgi:nucleoside-diphosphate-sugar epimerase